MKTVLDHFSLPVEDIQKSLDSALSKGGDFSEAFLEFNQIQSITMEEKIIKDTAESINRGIGIRVTKGDQSGYGYTNSLEFKKIEQAALTAANIASGNPSSSQIPKQVQYPHNYYSLIEPANKTSVEKKLDLVKRAYKTAENFDPRIIRVKTSLMNSFQKIAILNSEGLLIKDERPMVKLMCLAVAENKKNREAGFAGGGGRTGLLYFSDITSPEKIGEEAAKEAISLLNAQIPPAGEMPVILSPGHSGVFIHEAVGHLLEADFIRKKTSIFWNKIGKKVASEQVNIYDDPTISGYRGSYNIDDEGTIPKKTCLIRKGELKGLLQDRLSAKLLKMPLTGHGRRQNFSCLPIPRMSNTYIEAGEYEPEEILRSVKRGFYAHRFQGGQVEDSGKFTFTVSSGSLIENGKLTAPVKQATLIGTNVDILKQIQMVGSDLQFGPQIGTCGKDGQEAPVSDGCPTIKITRMTVGGQK